MKPRTYQGSLIDADLAHEGVLCRKHRPVKAEAWRFMRAVTYGRMTVEEAEETLRVGPAVRRDLLAFARAHGEYARGVLAILAWRRVVYRAWKEIRAHAQDPAATTRTPPDGA